MRKTGNSGINLIKQFEGLRLDAYYCPARILTIGYGHVVRKHDGIGLGQRISQQIADNFLEFDVGWSERCVEKYVNQLLNNNQFDALVSFVFNVGQSAFLRSGVLRNLNIAQFPSAIVVLKRYVHADGRKLNGLVRRRGAEANLFNS